MRTDFSSNSRICLLSRGVLDLKQTVFKICNVILEKESHYRHLDPTGVPQTECSETAAVDISRSWSTPHYS